MARPRRTSTLSTSSSLPSTPRGSAAPQVRPSQLSPIPGPPNPQSQELSSLYDYLLKIILVGPSGCGKSSLLHRLANPTPTAPLPPPSLHTPTPATLPYIPQTIGLDLRTHLVRLGAPPRSTRLKLQLWDTAGTERFRSVARSYYRASCAALVVYDVSSRESLAAAAAYVRDVRALAGDACVVVLVGNKADIDDAALPPLRVLGKKPSFLAASVRSSSAASAASDGTTTPGDADSDEEEEAPARQVPLEQADAFAASHGIPLVVEVSARTGEGVDALFRKVAGMVLARVEMGQVDPGDMASGVHYGDLGWGEDEGHAGGGSVRAKSVRGWKGLVGGGSAARPGRAAGSGCAC